jgi:hypothetical protein
VACAPSKAEPPCEGPAPGLVHTWACRHPTGAKALAQQSRWPRLLIATGHVALEYFDKGALKSARSYFKNSSNQLQSYKLSLS